MLKVMTSTDVVGHLERFLSSNASVSAAAALREAKVI